MRYKPDAMGKKILITTVSLNASGVAYLSDGAKKLGLDVEAIEYTRDSDSVLSMIRNSDYTFFRMAPVSLNRYAELNESLRSETLRNMLRAFDKYEAFLELERNGIATPRTCLVIGDVLPKGFDYPVVLKVACGNQGNGVELVRNKEESVVLKELREMGDKVICQEYIETAKGSDKRLIAVDGIVVAAMRRMAVQGNFKANLHQGGIAEVYNPSEKEIDMAVRATECLGLDFAGVDIVDGNDGPLILEVNPSPGFKISEIVGFDVPELIINRLIERRKI